MARRRRQPAGFYQRRCSEALEVPVALPVRHGPVEGGELDVGHVEVVLHHAVSEGGAGDLALAEAASRLPEVGGDAIEVARVGVADVGRLEIELVVDPVQAAGDEGG